MRSIPSMLSFMSAMHQSIAERKHVDDHRPAPPKAAEQKQERNRTAFKHHEQRQLHRPTRNAISRGRPRG